MAKLSARGRTTLQGVTKMICTTTGGATPAKEQRRLMSDGVILRKVTTACYKSGWAVLSTGNTDRLADGGKEWLDAKLARGWTKE